MCNTECNNKPCVHEDDLMCCPHMIHCCGGYSEHNNCCPHDRGCCNQCGCCPCCCKIKKLSKQLDELEETVTGDNSIQTDVEELKGRIEQTNENLDNLRDYTENSIDRLERDIHQERQDRLNADQIHDREITELTHRVDVLQDDVEDLDVALRKEIHDRTEADIVVLNNAKQYTDDKIDELDSYIPARSNEAIADVEITNGKITDYTYTDTIENALYSIRASQDENGDNIVSTYAKLSQLAPVAFSGVYSDLTGKPVIVDNISLSINPANYKLYATLKSGNTVVADSNVIDLPLETMVVDGSYDNTTKTLILTLDNGNNIEIPISELIGGLVNEDELSEVAFSGDYSDLTGKPTFTDKDVTLSWGNRSTIANIGGTEVHVTMPSNPDTDVKVYQKLCSDNAAYPILLTRTANLAQDATDKAGFGANVKVNPHTSTVIASKFDGTATKAISDGDGNNIVDTYATKDAFNDASKNGNDITFTRANGTNSFTFTLPTLVAAPGTLDTTDTDSLQVPANPENLSGAIKLHRISKTGAWDDLVGTPNFSDVATSGDYNDLTNKPTIPSGLIQSDWSQTDTNAKDYIKNKPSIPSTSVTIGGATYTLLEAIDYIIGIIPTQYWSRSNGNLTPATATDTVTAPAFYDSSVN